MSDEKTFDVLIIGSGAAGLSLALKLDPNLKTAILAKGSMSETNTRYAQGGVAAVMTDSDSFEAHASDTTGAGAGLCDTGVVDQTVAMGPDSIQWLIDQGVDFTRDTDEQGAPYHLTREGGHSRRRVIHAADATGKAIQETLQARVSERDNLHVFEQYLVVDLITSERLGLPGNNCLGAYVFCQTTGTVQVFNARTVVLATGGAGKVYLYTSNPDVATGDGIAMAWRAGCRVANMEFVQFHPTCLYHPQAKSFLLTEALRGEGARLLLPDGSRFMQKFDDREELAPRDVVARAIDHEMKRLGADCVYLDISHKPADFIKNHFPTVYERCLDFGFDLTTDPVPVVPAAHYNCGGVMTDLSGRTDVDGLYAIGETAFTGLHGSNRMASNSLLECLVFAETAAADIAQHIDQIPQPPSLPGWDESRVTDSDEEVVVSHNWNELRHFMWDYVGIVRTTKRLQRAKRRAALLRTEVAEYYGNFRISNDLIELRNLLVVADLIIESALRRQESRGLHFTLDFPARLTSTTPSDTILIPENYQSGPEDLKLAR